ncbi:MAG: chromosomal replication initiator protein DnaA [Spirochaetia bacterium]|jgi:chromosomal replication initiator protein|uniref:Chromosomal replication initiator protein DnaA n=1 Tax=bioreactor metagenome TaxID=1076179 RepID=A0A644TVF3_9ZZZZ|nr:chromosomal replication initiator protein DnaA [Spirochaetia bacterium]MDD3821383.1 chromosomal replication initiator protein DnaA [Spirochaetales bacterium]NLX44704.1 chromosomal replication initiator protein DnaA [Treponema sp.]HAP55464.1 chromosomal replication initiator protein DnaA [Spirochaetaceae bacterium]MCE1208716.1 chromosomal replication initiator protein DnaA [Spirochaetia bacterium]
MAEFDGSVIWSEALEIAKGEIPEQEYLMWFRLGYHSLDGNTLTVKAPNSFLRDQFKRKYHAFMEKIVREITALDIALEVSSTKAPEPRAVQGVQAAVLTGTVSGRDAPGGGEAKTDDIPSIIKTGSGVLLYDNAGSRDDGTAANAGGPSPAPAPGAFIPSAQPVTSVAERRPHPSLRQDYRFENFIVGENNRFIFNASEAVAKSPARVYNPLLIYGGVGLGKTHLMHAIGNHVYQTRPGTRIICITAEEFTNEFIQMIHDRSAHEFKNKYRNADILLIDDIHFFQNKPGVQEELFHTFNALYDSERQMVFTLDRHVKELKDFSDRLKSRFDKGLVVDVQPPIYETRVAILKQKLLQSGKKVNVVEEVIDLVASNVSSNVRDLEGCLTKLTAYAELVHKDLSVDIARNLLKEMFNAKRHSAITVDSIIRMVADFYKLSLSDLKGKKRSKNIALARQVAMFVIREVTEYSTTEIGVEFGGRDHTTVMHSCQKIEQMLKFDPSFDATMQRLLRDARQNGAE